MLGAGGEHAATDTPLSTVCATPGDAGEATQHHAAAAHLLSGGATASLNLEAADAEGHLARLARWISDPAADLQVTTEVARGDPAQLIIARTQTRPSILALATHGRAGFDALWSASVGSRVIARGNGPFLLVHPEPASVEPLGQGSG